MTEKKPLLQNVVKRVGMCLARLQVGTSSDEETASVMGEVNVLLSLLRESELNGEEYHLVIGGLSIAKRNICGLHSNLGEFQSLLANALEEITEGR